jgi:hypothetical protein
MSTKAKRTKAKRLTARLPATVCTPEMRDKVVEIAQARGVSLSDIQREALSLFLAKSVTKCDLTSHNIAKA